MNGLLHPGRLHHGGRLHEASIRYGVALGDWLDLSTGINPHRYPVPAIPPEVWHRLPDDDDDRLVRACCDAYDAPAALPVAGTQAALQVLPQVLPALSGATRPWRLRVRALSYAEHAHAWRRAGHEVEAVQARPDPDDLSMLEAELDAVDVLLLVNPNNPGGQRVPADRLLTWLDRLAAHGGWLVIDEAYLDALPQAEQVRLSLSRMSHRPGLVVLRSVGKFYGLAGARVGAVLAAPTVLHALGTVLGPWAVSGPSTWVAAEALRDRTWADEMRETLTAADGRLADLLRSVGLDPRGGPLYRCSLTPQAHRWHEALASRGIWTRLFDPTVTGAPAAWRLGLPSDEDGWQRLTQALSMAKVPCDFPAIGA